jgi:hypothetical protein
MGINGDSIGDKRGLIRIAIPSVSIFIPPQGMDPSSYYAHPFYNPALHISFVIQVNLHNLHIYFDISFVIISALIQYSYNKTYVGRYMQIIKIHKKHTIYFR